MLYLIKPVSVVAITLSALNALAEPAKISWPSRNSEVVCGGSADGKDLKMRVSLEEGLLVAETDDHRVLVFIDLTKPGRVKWVMGEIMTDGDYAAREKIAAKLSPEEADPIRRLTKNRTSEMYMGFTDGYVHLRTDFGKLYVTVSCQELAKR